MQALTQYGTWFTVLFIIDALTVLVALGFFIMGWAEATPGSRFIQAWVKIFSMLGLALVAGYLLAQAGWQRTANVVLGIPAALVVGYLLFLLLILITKPRWN